MMTSKGRQLQLYTGGAAEPAAAAFSPADTLYAHANPDGSRKRCQACALWLVGLDQCWIHNPDVFVSGDMVCGYHVFGRPLTVAPVRENLDFVDPEFSGLTLVPGGSSCDTCAFYTPQGMTEGTCTALREGPAEEHPIVAALGCCTKWTPI